MTGADRLLDVRQLESDGELTLFRIAKKKYANLSGAGSALAPGRWNRSGEDAIYTSVDVGLPVLERLVHTPKDVLPRDLVLMTIHVAGSWVSSDAFTSQPQPFQGPGLIALPTLAQAGVFFEAHSNSRWESLGTHAIAVPSVIVPAWNVVLYPRTPGFDRYVRLVKLESFEFDQRLFPEDVPETVSQVMA